MIIDCLIDPSDIVIEQLDKGATIYDEDAREAVKQVRRATQVLLEAQVSSTRDQRTAFKRGGQGGAQNEASGYLVFMRRDVEDAGVTLARGDRIISIADIPKDPVLFLTGKQNAGHLSNDPNLEIWDYSDKRPGN